MTKQAKQSQGKAEAGYGAHVCPIGGLLETLTRPWTGSDVWIDEAREGHPKSAG